MSQMRVAQPTAPRVGADRVVNYLTETLKELDGCQSNLEIQKVASKVESVFTGTMGCGSDSASVVEAIKKAEASLREEGQSVKASRMAKIGKLMVSLPKKNPKKQRKMLREVLQLCGKNVGVNIGKRGLCCGSNSLFCNAAVLTGSVLALAGATTVIALAATGQFDADNFALSEETPVEAEETPGQSDNFALSEETPVEAEDTPQETSEPETEQLTRRQRRQLNQRFAGAAHAAGRFYDNEGNLVDMNAGDMKRFQQWEDKLGKEEVEKLFTHYQGNVDHLAKQLPDQHAYLEFDQESIKEAIDNQEATAEDWRELRLLKQLLREATSDSYENMKADWNEVTFEENSVVKPIYLNGDDPVQNLKDKLRNSRDVEYFVGRFFRLKESYAYDDIETLKTDLDAMDNSHTLNRAQELERMVDRLNKRLGLDMTFNKEQFIEDMSPIQEDRGRGRLISRFLMKNSGQGLRDYWPSGGFRWISERFTVEGLDAAVEE